MQARFSIGWANFGLQSDIGQIFGCPKCLHGDFTGLNTAYKHKTVQDKNEGTRHFPGKIVQTKKMSKKILSEGKAMLGVMVITIGYSLAVFDPKQVGMVQ
jgi:hypothetical protein